MSVHSPTATNWALVSESSVKTIIRNNMEKVFYLVICLRKKLWINASLEQLRTYHPSPNPKSTLTEAK